MTIDRRLFLAGLGATALASSARAARPRRVAVIGGGIVGTAIAMNLARAGARVDLFEAIAPAAGATSKSLAWINPFVDDAAYMALRLDSVARWRKLDRALGLGVTWGGYVNFTDHPDERDRMAIQARLLADHGHPVKALDRAGLKAISPAIDPGNLVAATWSDLGGHVDPVHATARYGAAAQAHGARIHYPDRVTAIEPGPERVRLRTSGGLVEVDHVVVAGGVETPALLAPLGYPLPLVHRPGALVHSKPLPPLTRIVYDGPGEFEFKQMTNGVFVGEEASGPPPLAVHGAIRDHAMAFPPGLAEAHGRRILSRIGVYMPGLRKAEVDFVTLGFRPVPADGFPVVGPLPGIPGVTVCVTHSGVSLSAALGAMVAGEVLSGAPSPLLAPYRPDRAMPA